MNHGFDEGADNIFKGSWIGSVGFDLMEGAKPHRMAYPHFLPIRLLSRLLHIYMRPMAAAPATHAHYCLRTPAADLDMSDYILFRYNITRRNIYDDTFFPLATDDIGSLVLGSTLYGES